MIALPATALASTAVEGIGQAFAAASGAQISLSLAISALLFVIGLVGFMVRRNMIIMFLCTELMFQGAALAMVTFARMHMDVSGQVFVIFILTVAAAEAALALGLVVLLHRRRETLSAEVWSDLGEA
ncbi:MAG: NADH-quinone oxidoreductase subunit NuoK [Phycisphaerae bacterium]|nr:NADH-quinone oxidoreductase subunit NuoK [Phycisphaerae bacterium]